MRALNLLSPLQSTDIVLIHHRWREIRARCVPETDAEQKFRLRQLWLGLPETSSSIKNMVQTRRWRELILNDLTQISPDLVAYLGLPRRSLLARIRPDSSPTCPPVALPKFDHAL